MLKLDKKRNAQSLVSVKLETVFLVPETKLLNALKSLRTGHVYFQKHLVEVLNELALRNKAASWN
jgi:hypothetical protein